MVKNIDIGNQYVTQKCFEDISKNQSKLIDILNHRMTRLEIDVIWIKKIMAIQTSLLAGMFIAILGLVLKLVLI
jgi:hypothetical protein